MIRPGGTDLTERALRMAGILPGSAVFDIGCGSGETVKDLLEKGYRASGIDLIAPNTENLRQADAASMPYADGTADGLLFECSFSKMQEPDQVLKEAYRVLKQDGRLIVADMIARKEEGRFEGYLGRLETQEHLIERLKTGSFRLLASQRQDEATVEFFGNLVLEKGSEEAGRLLGGSLREIRKTSPGYVILVLEKENISVKDGRREKDGNPEKDSSREKDGSPETQAAYAREHSAYYRKTLPKKIGSLRELPFTDAASFREDPEAFLCVSQTKVKRVVTLGTSGTTGERKRLFFTENDLECTVRFFKEGMGPMVKAGQTAGILFAGDGENGLPELIAKALSRLGVAPQIYCGCISKEEFCRGKDFLTGMPADLFRLSVIAPDLKPKTVLLSGDYVPESLRSALKKTWGCEVFTHYGMTETGYGLAVECSAHSGMHIRTKDILVEAVDPENGAPLPAGREGELVITTLNREAMPFLRYRTGDIGTLEEENLCDCGLKTPKIRKICGRKEDVTGHIAETGTVSGYPSINEISEILYGFPGVLAFEARRSGATEERKIRILLECLAKTDTGTIKKHLETVFRGTLFDVVRTEKPISTVLKKRLL